MIKIPKLETNRLILRSIEDRDIPSYQKNFVDYEVIRFLSATVPWPYPENGVEFFIHNILRPGEGKDRFNWGIFEKDNPDELIGVVNYWRQGRPENRGFWLAKKCWGKGLMTEAVEVTLDFIFSATDFDKLIFANAVGNERSRRIKEKTGAKLVGVAPAKFVDPSFTEHEIWELYRNDWNAYRSASPLPEGVTKH